MLPGSLAGCVASLREELPTHANVKPETFELYTRAAQDLRPQVDNATRTQPEFQLAIWDYLARLADAQRAARGRELMQRETTALAALNERHGVDAATTVAVFGVETDYGRVAGRYPVIDATLSRACLNLKSAERKRHFFAALWLLQEGAVKPEQFKGSWAGAFGMTQFMPGTFVSYMNDGDGAPAADIINSVPDALATTARYLRGLGWNPGVSWGVEVKVPPAMVSMSALCRAQAHGPVQARRRMERGRGDARGWQPLARRRRCGTPRSVHQHGAAHAGRAEWPGVDRDAQLPRAVALQPSGCLCAGHRPALRCAARRAAAARGLAH